jgi:hypothetical protein
MVYAYYVHITNRFAMVGRIFLMKIHTDHPFNLPPKPNLEVRVFGDDTLVLRHHGKKPNAWRRFWQWFFIGTTYKDL